MVEIFKAINEVMKAVGYVRKKKAGGLNYSFAGEAALIAALRPEMVENGLFVAPVAIDSNMGQYTTNRGSEMNHAIVTVTYRFAHISGETLDVTVTGEGADVGDKAMNKAMTGAFKYALRQTFCIETGDDPDKFPSEPRAGRESKVESQPIIEELRDLSKDDEVMVKGKNDEKLGMYLRQVGEMALVRVGGREIKVSPQRVTPVPEVS